MKKQLSTEKEQRPAICSFDDVKLDQRIFFFCASNLVTMYKIPNLLGGLGTVLGVARMTKEAVTLQNMTENYKGNMV